MLQNIKNENVLFLDIETVSQYKSYDNVSEIDRSLWDKKAGYLSRSESDTPNVLYERAGIYAEFGKIIVISVGILRENKLRIKSFYGHDEYLILKEFTELLNRSYNKSDSLLCAHNGKEFDFPYISRRLIVNNIKLPSILDTAMCKPWEIRHIDTMELWKFGDHKNYTSLELLTRILGIETPKDDIMGSQVGSIYWQDGDLERIKVYCQKDVVAIARLYQRFKGEIPIAEEDIIVL